MKISKTTSGFMLIGGIGMTIICGQIAAFAGGTMESPADDLFYDVIAWVAALGAFAGLGVFFWGAKIFSAAGTQRRYRGRP